MARKDIHSFVSGMGGACSIVETLVREARDCGLPDKVIHQLTTDNGRKIIRGWVESLRVGTQSAPTLHDRILAGHYDWWDENLLKWRREDTPPTILGEGKPIHLNRALSTEAVEETELDKLGYRSANLEELCDYGAKHPEEQRSYPIVALKSVFVHPTNGGRYSPFLCGNGARRELGLGYRGSDWLHDCRFLAVRK